MKAAALLLAIAVLAAGCGRAAGPGSPTNLAAASPTLDPTEPAPASTAPASAATATATATATSAQSGCPSVLTGEGGPPEPVTPPDDLATLEITGRVDLPEESLFVVSSGDAVWATSPAGKVWRIDAATGKVTHTVDLPDLGFARPLATPDAIWLAEMESGRLLRMDPKDGSVDSSVDLEPADRPMALAASERGLLVANQTTDTLSFVDATSLEVTDQIDLSEAAPGDADRAPSSIAVDGDSAWVVEHRAHALAQVSIADGTVSRTCLGDPAAGQLAAAASQLWVAGAGGVVSTVDPANGEVTGRLLLPAVTAGDLAVDGDMMWVGAGSHMIGIDTVAAQVEVAAPTGELSDQREFPGGVAVAVTPDSVWTTDPAGSGLLQFAKADD